METMEQQRHSLSSLPMLSRLDHLDFVIKNLERQQNLPKCNEENASITRELIDRGTAIREAYSRGSLLDRIVALETRLFQICLELESSSGYSTSTGGSGETSSSSLSVKRDLTKTLPIFSSNTNHLRVPLHRPRDLREIEERIEEEKEEEEFETEKPLLDKKKRKKTKSPKKWSRFTLLGC